MIRLHPCINGTSDFSFMRALADMKSSRSSLMRSSAGRDDEKAIKYRDSVTM